MAMDKNDKLNLFRKVPKLVQSQKLHPKNQLEFVDMQILERQKMLFREYVTIEMARQWADESDVDANKSAEQAVPAAVTNMKGVMLELKALQEVRKKIIEEYPELKDTSAS